MDSSIEGYLPLQVVFLWRLSSILISPFSKFQNEFQMVKMSPSPFPICHPKWSILNGNKNRSRGQIGPNWSNGAIQSQTSLKGVKRNQRGNTEPNSAKGGQTQQNRVQTELNVAKILAKISIHQFWDGDRPKDWCPWFGYEAV